MSLSIFGNFKYIFVKEIQFLIAVTATVSTAAVMNKH